MTDLFWPPTPLEDSEPQQQSFEFSLVLAINGTSPAGCRAFVNIEQD